MVLKLLLMTVINHCRWPFCNSGRGWSARMLACDAPHKCAPNPLPPLCLLTPGLFTSIDLWLQWFLLQDSRIEANLCWSSCRSPAHVMRAKNCSAHIFIDVTYATESAQLDQGVVARVGARNIRSRIEWTCVPRVNASFLVEAQKPLLCNSSHVVWSQPHAVPVWDPWQTKNHLKRFS
jgi:hypothetical protein